MAVIDEVALAFRAQSLGIPDQLFGQILSAFGPPITKVLLDWLDAKKSMTISMDTRHNIKDALVRVLSVAAMLARFTATEADDRAVKILTQLLDNTELLDFVLDLLGKRNGK